ncbi:hypothetical protein GCM10009839_51860 [Catenulispora yoronensis]|uniref:Uncharacterized protein n=1 Tax=Catenulispora yoronensis TaxID=450799 RepID=A0ABN2UTN4_9ACTN
MSPRTAIIRGFGFGTRGGTFTGLALPLRVTGHALLVGTAAPGSGASSVLDAARLSTTPGSGASRTGNDFSAAPTVAECEAVLFRARPHTTYNA